MEKTTLYLDEREYRRLKQIAQRRGRKPAELVREAVSEYTARHEQDRAAPASIGAFASSKRDLASRDEDYLSDLGKD